MSSPAISVDDQQENAEDLMPPESPVPPACMPPSSRLVSDAIPFANFQYRSQTERINAASTSDGLQKVFPELLENPNTPASKRPEIIIPSSKNKSQAVSKPKYGNLTTKPTWSNENDDTALLAALTDPGSYFAGLEDLESEVVELLGIKSYHLVDSRVVDASFYGKQLDFDDYWDALQRIRQAFELLYQRGFISEHYNMLIGDPHRPQVAVCQRVSRISLYMIESAVPSSCLCQATMIKFPRNII